MKKLKIYISHDSLPSRLISDFDRKIPDSTRNSSGFQIAYNEVTMCISDFISRAIKITQVGTSIHLEREIKFNNLEVFIILDSPKKSGMFKKIKRTFGLS